MWIKTISLNRISTMGIFIQLLISSPCHHFFTGRLRKLFVMCLCHDVIKIWHPDKDENANNNNMVMIDDKWVLTLKVFHLIRNLRAKFGSRIIVTYMLSAPKWFYYLFISQFSSISSVACYCVNTMNKCGNAVYEIQHTIDEKKFCSVFARSLGPTWQKFPRSL